MTLFSGLHYSTSFNSEIEQLKKRWNTHTAFDVYVEMPVSVAVEPIGSLCSTYPKVLYAPDKSTQKKYILHDESTNESKPRINLKKVLLTKLLASFITIFLQSGSFLQYNQIPSNINSNFKTLLYKLEE